MFSSVCLCLCLNYLLITRRRPQANASVRRGRRGGVKSAQSSSGVVRPYRPAQRRVRPTTNTGV